MNHQGYMARALQLAALGRYSTSPNPRVGCVLVRDGVIVGEGFHERAGEGHAEVNALRQAGEQARGATAYVTLEPCSHFGRTPPCSQALINAGVTTVVGALRDPNPMVSGRGYQQLRDAGINVIESCLASDAYELNRGFMQRMTLGRPWVQLKIAQSLDGRTAMSSGESQWITGPHARRDVQRLRAASCAIITGADSVLIDDPAMTVRPEQAGFNEQTLWRQPLRVIVDGQQRVLAHAKIVQQTGDILIAHCLAAQPLERAEVLGHLDYWQSPASSTEHAATITPRVDLSALLRELGHRQCNHVLIESGANLAGAFIERSLVDEIIVYCAPTLLGSTARPMLNLPLTQMAEQQRWQWHDVRQVGNDMRFTLRRPTTES
ncbi:MAG: bifunctional diaminohydroxyphosphoribosylaminopyrimidine deaminase/5-amino-6-(5-phosphoribosylamino)uracil reductase RibD [Bacterioplanes sp.]|nr:bifunctional diaminohydroxyphosphoribosylaminopyrimidine deaminase/5-amino-6-(5-phosphoribosylamino)uracil reductase RibD [Bacterioplanes sp.]